jgi:hypothetical protein
MEEQVPQARVARLGGNEVGLEGTGAVADVGDCEGLTKIKPLARSSLAARRDVDVFAMPPKR